MSARRTLGEIVLRTGRRDEMVAFYRDVVGLSEYRTLSAATFLKIADDLEGHPQVLAIFEASIPSNGPGEPALGTPTVDRGPLHHFAFALTREDFRREHDRLAALGHRIRTATHPSMSWRSLYLYDPDGNTVELVCWDEAVGQEPARLSAAG